MVVVIDGCEGGEVNCERISPRFKRLVAALLAVPMAAVVLTSSPVSAGPASASTSPEGDVFAPSTVEGKGEVVQAARTSTGNVEIERPDFAITPCPEMTDSIVRLYSAYFLRAPDEGGFNFWLDEYSLGNWSLPRMSAHFSQSAEFVETYGDLTDEQFIDLIYNNIFGRDADQGGRDYWLGRMETEGLDRGTVMLFFSESPEYVEQSFTFTPLAGEFNWYPEGAEWYCGFDYLDAALPEARTWVDIAFYNSSARPNTVTANLLVDGEWVFWDQATINTGEWFIFFGEEISDPGITGVELVGSNDFIWTLVYSPSPTPPVRAGWVAI